VLGPTELLVCIIAARTIRVQRTLCSCILLKCEAWQEISRLATPLNGCVLPPTLSTYSFPLEFRLDTGRLGWQ
jgi:hypothetical protein